MTRQHSILTIIRLMRLFGLTGRYSLPSMAANVTEMQKVTTLMKKMGLVPTTYETIDLWGEKNKAVALTQTIHDYKTFSPSSAHCRRRQLNNDYRSTGVSSLYFFSTIVLIHTLISD